MCLPPLYYCSPLWWLLYLAGSATATADRMSAASRLWQCNRPSSPLLRLHVPALRLKPSAGRPQPYVMRSLRLVPPKQN